MSLLNGSLGEILTHHYRNHLHPYFTRKINLTDPGKRLGFREFPLSVTENRMLRTSVYEWYELTVINKQTCPDDIQHAVLSSTMMV